MSNCIDGKESVETVAKTVRTYYYKNSIKPNELKDKVINVKEDRVERYKGDKSYQDRLGRYQDLLKKLAHLPGINFKEEGVKEGWGLNIGKFKERYEQYQEIDKRYSTRFGSIPVKPLTWYLVLEGHTSLEM